MKKRERRFDDLAHTVLSIFTLGIIWVMRLVISRAIRVAVDN